MKKPPLGLMPKFLVDEIRLQQIDEAIARYNEDKLPVHEAWITEQQKLHDEMYEEIVSRCLEANKLIDEGHIMLDEDNKYMQGRFIFLFMKIEGIFIEIEKNYCSSYLYKNKRSVHGADTLTEEYRTAKQYLSTIKLIPTTNAIYPFKK